MRNARERPTSSAALQAQIVELTRERDEARQQQAATADVLKVISRSAFDLQAVLDTLLQSAAMLCNARRGVMFKRKDDAYHAVAFYNASPEIVDFVSAHPVTPGRHTITARVALERRAIHVSDLQADAEYRYVLRDTHPIRTELGVPMFRGEDIVGVIILYKLEVAPFTKKQIELVTTFADQAVIAIENARLFGEVQARTRDLADALQQQTATANVLKVISRSAFDLDAVFTTLTTSAAELIGATMGTIATRDGDVFRYRAFCGVAPDVTAFLTEHPATPGRKSAVGRVALSGEVVRVPDLLEDADYAVPTGQSRSILAVPLLRNETVEGVFTIARAEPGDFTPRQIGLLQTFADQAVIAIENVRLFDEVQARTRDLTEALQQQTATANVLKVISRSAFDLQAVFDTLINSAVELIGAATGAIATRDNHEVLRYRAFCGLTPEVVAYLADHPAKPGRETSAGRVALSGKVECIPDVLDDRDYVVPTHDLYRSVLAVPLLRNDAVEGVFSIGRKERGDFTPRQIELMQTFADQAVIAIENARLFDEVQARTRELSESLQQQTATADVLKVISRSAFDLQAVFDTLINSAVELIGGANGTICLRDGDVFRYRAHSNMAPELVAYLDAHPAMPGRGSSVGRVLLSGKVECLPDLLDDADYVVPTHLYNRTRSILAAPILRNDAVEGVLVITRTQPGDFTQRQIEIVQTFADQAVIAIENVRLFDEVQARTRELSEALQQQTATADVLKAISRSAFDLDTVLVTLISTAVRLCNAHHGEIFRRDGDVYLHAASKTGLDPAYDEHERKAEIRAGRGTVVGRAALERRAVRIADAWSDPDYQDKDAARLGNVRAMLGVPLMREGEPIGAFALARSEPLPFSEREVELVTTFADQAVIAIENVRLFGQVQDRTRELTQSLDDLRNAQDRLIQTEKLASLGQLTAGIAHEIKNPLNFVNNFADLSRDLLYELSEIIGAAGPTLDEKARDEIGELTGMLESNLEKVVQHGRRADSIVKNMLLHSRGGGGERRDVDLNAVVEESLNLAYHGARAEKPGFNITLGKDLDPAVGKIDIYPQEFTRVLLNLISNGFYAAHRKKLDGGGAAFEPSLAVSTRALPACVEIRIRDNGTGIPDSVKAKMFNPFFTTKPAGEGTGLGLSLSHDIVVKQHGGTLAVDTELGEFTEFIITLPRATATGARPGGGS